MRFIPTITAPVYPDPSKKMGNGYGWSSDELKVIRERYLHEGLNACIALLPARGERSIIKQANEMGLRRQKQHAKPRQSNDMLDAAIKRLYAGGYAAGELKAFCARYHVSRQWVYWRAKALGVLQSKSEYNRPWSPEEDAIIEEFTHLHPESIARRLQKAGFDRKPAAVQNRRVRLGCYMPDPDVYSAHALAQCMGLDDHRVIDFIRRHGLKAKQIDADHRSAWKIHRRDLRKWLISSAEWDHRRCNREWLIEILAGKVGIGADAVTERAV